MQQYIVPTDNAQQQFYTHDCTNCLVYSASKVHHVITCGGGTYSQEARMPSSIVDHAQQEAVGFLGGCLGPRHKHQLLTEAAYAGEPGLCLTRLYIHPDESLHALQDWWSVMLLGDKL